MANARYVILNTPSYLFFRINSLAASPAQEIVGIVLTYDGIIAMRSN